LIGNAEELCCKGIPEGFIKPFQSVQTVSIDYTTEIHHIDGDSKDAGVFL